MEPKHNPDSAQSTKTIVCIGNSLEFAKASERLPTARCHTRYESLARFLSNNGSAVPCHLLIDSLVALTESAELLKLVLESNHTISIYVLECCDGQLRITRLFTSTADVNSHSDKELTALAGEINAVTQNGFDGEAVGQIVRELTVSERFLAECICRGETNQSIASKLDLSQRTIEDRRSKLFRKFQVRTAPEMAWHMGRLYAHASSAVPDG